MTRVTAETVALAATRGKPDSVGIRIDPAHAGGASVHSDEAAAAPHPDAQSPSAPELPGAPDLSFDAAEQTRQQAGQLAAHLVARQWELDRREAALHAQAAQWEADCARMRLLLEERQHSVSEDDRRLAEQAQHLTERERTLAEREARAHAERVETKLYFDRLEAELELRESQLSLAEERLSTERKLVHQAEAELRRSRERSRGATRRREQQLNRRRDEIESRARHSLRMLERRRAAIEAMGDRGAVRPEGADPSEAAEMAQLRDALRWELLAVRRLLDEHETAMSAVRATQDTFAAEQESAERRLAEREGELAEISRELDKRRAGLAQLEAELAESHRAILAERLGSETLDAEASLGNAVRQWERRAQELESLRMDLAKQHERTLRQQEALEKWTAARQREIAEKTRALARREESLNLRAAQLAREEIELRARTLAAHKNR